MSKIKLNVQVLFILLVILVFFFGIWGYSGLLNNSNTTIWDVLYSIWQMFVLESGDPVSLNWKLILAKYLAALIVGFGIFSLIFKHVKIWIDRIRIKYFFKNHYIICGLGKVGYKLAVDLYKKKKKEKILIIEKDKNNKYISELRGLGAVVLIYNALDKNIIGLLNFKKASSLIINTGLDESNIEIANNFSDYYHSYDLSNIVNGYVHINDPENQRVLNDFLELYHDTKKFDITIFNIYQTAAQIIYDTFSPIKYLKNNSEKDAIAIWGYNKTAEAFIIENIILSQYSKVKKLNIYLIETNAQEIIKKIEFKFPFIQKYIKLIALDLENELLEFDGFNKISELIKSVYVFGNDDAKVINMAKIMAQSLYVNLNIIKAVPIIACLYETSNIFELLKLPASNTNKGNNTKLHNDVFEDLRTKFNIHFIRLLSDTCSKRILIDSNMQVDILAKIINYYFSIKYLFIDIIKSHFKISNTDKLKETIIEIEECFIDFKLSTNKPLREIEELVLNIIYQKLGLSLSRLENKLSIEAMWSPLSDWLKASNRYSARHIPIKQSIINKKHINLADIKDNMKILAQIEHQRWCAEKQVFRYKNSVNLSKDVNKRDLKNQLHIHDQIIDYDQLNDENKEKDYNLFQLIPLLNRIITLSNS